ncbi:MAG TPA: ferritin family protein [Tissierellaceae bacterium]
MDRQTIHSIIDFAIDTEIDSYDFYKEAINKTEDIQAKIIFGNLAEEELKHKEFLEKLLKDDSYSFDLEQFTDYKISEDIYKDDYSEQIDLKDAIAIAIKKEEEAMYMYKALSDDSVNKEVKDLFLDLSKMEQMHKVKLEEIYIKL